MQFYPSIDHQGTQRRSHLKGTALANLKRAAVQNIKRDERLELTRLDPVPIAWIQRVGEYLEKSTAETAATRVCSD